MPTDFWRNAQMLNIFRSKPCQRLARDGVCQWKSRCQFSHCTEWPRRPPQKHRYSPEICPHIQVSAINKDGTVQIQNKCTMGLACPCAHSMEEVLYHPQIFKTILCEEHLRKDDSQRKQRGKKSKCHRYYCPFAHGNDELRTTSLTPAQRDQCLRALDMFPSSECCRLCVAHRLSSAPPPQVERTSVETLQKTLVQQAHDAQRTNGTSSHGLPPHLLQQQQVSALSHQLAAMLQNPRAQNSQTSQLCQHHGLVTSAPKASSVPVPMISGLENNPLFRMPSSPPTNNTMSAGYTNGVHEKDPFLMPPDESLVSGSKSPQLQRAPDPVPASSSVPKDSWLDSPAFITISNDGSTTMTIGSKRPDRLTAISQNFHAI